MDVLQEKVLIHEALNAREQAYAPYSQFHVGAAILSRDGAIYTGSNIENASYGATICAERVAILHAVHEGKRDFHAIAIIGGKADRHDASETMAYPCGLCRQVLQEFFHEDTVVLVAKSAEDYKRYAWKELFPYAFGPEQM